MQQTERDSEVTKRELTRVQKELEQFMSNAATQALHRVELGLSDIVHPDSLVQPAAQNPTESTKFPPKHGAAASQSTEEIPSPHVAQGRSAVPSSSASIEQQKREPFAVLLERIGGWPYVLLSLVSFTILLIAIWLARG